MSAPRARVAAVVLAAGHSTRMGARNKLLLPIASPQSPPQSMLACVVHTLSMAPIEPIVVVTGHDAGNVRAALAEYAVRFTHNPAHREGMGTSLAAGITAVPPTVHSALICLGDMPLLQVAHIQALIDVFEPTLGRAICVPIHRGQRGHPVLFAARFFRDLQKLQGDIGARQIIREHANLVCEVAMADATILTDVDTPAALDDLMPSLPPPSSS